jgi:hypothetical protein
MSQNGFTIELKDDLARASIRDQYSVPNEIQTCHTAIVDGYVVEGHVPATEVKKMLAERPDIVGLGVIGMPPGSPGMEDGNQTEVPYDVVSFDENGILDVYASYP